MSEVKVTAHTCVSCKQETKNMYCKKDDVLIQAGHKEDCLLYDKHDMTHPFKVFN